MVNNQYRGDIRDDVFRSLADCIITSAVSNTREGMIYGIEAAVKQATELGMDVVSNVRDGMYVSANETLMMLRGTPKQTAIAEELIIGEIAKASGVATAAKRAVDLAQGQVEIVCGSIKKMPQPIRVPLRHAVMAAGAGIRIAAQPFVYLDKNYIRMFGNIRNALAAVQHFHGYTIAIQLRNEHGNIRQETIDACMNGAHILMLDTGCADDIGIVLETVNTLSMREKVKIAFAGDIKLDDIPSLRTKGVDSICIGRDIIDAPVLDLKFDVIQVEERMAKTNFAMNLLEKSELWIEKISLTEVNLSEIARRVAAVLGLSEKDVFVVDVRPDHITLDILKKTMAAEQIAGKQQAILKTLSEIEGFELTEESFVHSNGVLGLIALEDEDVGTVLQNMREMARSVQETFEKRVCVFPTGFEVQQGMIQDTNSPYIAELLGGRGYEVDIHSPLPDNRDAISEAIEDAANNGYSMIILTGGVGAEDKDCTVEAVLRVDPQAATPWIVKYQKGIGRHVKWGVRIAVGSTGNVLIVSLPGPNDEVRLAMDVLVSNLGGSIHKLKLAQEIATVLRQKIQNKWNHETEV